MKHAIAGKYTEQLQFVSFPFFLMTQDKTRPEETRLGKQVIMTRTSVSPSQPPPQSSRPTPPPGSASASALHYTAGLLQHWPFTQTSPGIAVERPGHFHRPDR